MAKETQKTTIVKDKIREYLADTWENLIEDIDSLDPKERVDRRMKLLEYVMPKAAAVKTEEKQNISIAQAILGGEAKFGEYEEENTRDEIMNDDDL